jgi:hypothetical protein
MGFGNEEELILLLKKLSITSIQRSHEKKDVSPFVEERVTYE